MDNLVLTLTDPYEVGAVPFAVKGAEVAACEVAGITSVEPFKGKQDTVSTALKTACGVDLPDVGSSKESASHKIVWAQLNQWYVFGPSLTLKDAATTDQSDGWAGLRLTGPRAFEVLSRLAPIDLRDLTRGRVVRTECAHRMALIIAGQDGYDIWVMRSLARDFLRHLKEAMSSVAAISSKIPD